jgi:hypothetical protein
MEKYDVAYFKEQGVVLVVIFLDSSFEYKTNEEQAQIVIALQVCATSAGLAGTVIPVWEVGNSFKFIAPKNWHAFFRTPNIYQVLLANINKELTCNF